MKLSIIIPTCNEANYINPVIQALLERAAEKPYEIIVVDCGSTDGTVESIESSEVVIVTNARLAGKKWSSLRMGAKLAQGDVLLFMDADTFMPENYDQAIEKALLDSRVVGGAFEFSFDKFTYSLFLISLINRIRYRLRKRFYGDQGIFVRKETYMAAGGWPRRSLMEAAYLCKDLQKHGCLKLLREKSVTSSRRFTEGGIWRVFFHDLKIWCRDLLGMDVERYGRSYWQINQKYGSKKKEDLLPESLEREPFGIAP